jgi:Arc/MetJ-type ribon-helix-helix transcriptional regulator
MKNGKSISLPSDLYQKLEKKVSETGFNSVDEFVAYVLEKVLEDDEPEKEMSAEDEAEVKKRLKSLGYFE